MDGCELSLSVTALANAISARCSPEDAALLALVFTQLGDTLALIVFRKSQCGQQNSCAADQ